MQVTIKYRAQLAALTKTESELIMAAKVKDVIRHIKTKFGAHAGKTAKTMLIVVNGQSILHLKHFKTILNDGDEVGFFPICAGG